MIADEVLLIMRAMRISEPPEYLIADCLATRRTIVCLDGSSLVRHPRVGWTTRRWSFGNERFLLAARGLSMSAAEVLASGDGVRLKIHPLWMTEDTVVFTDHTYVKRKNGVWSTI